MYDDKVVRQGDGLTMVDFAGRCSDFEVEGLDFLVAFLELLEVQENRNSSPIVFFPDGPQPLH